MKCETKHDHYVCECGKEFNSPQSRGAHQANCDVHKQLLNEEREKRRLPNGMFKCENPGCSNEHDGSYGTGRFCSEHCRRVYIGRHSIETRKSNGTFKSPFQDDAYRHNRSPYGTWKCCYCDVVFETKHDLNEHKRKYHPLPKGQVWNKGKTAETDPRIDKWRIAMKEGYGSGRIIPAWRGKHHSEETKKKLSEAMKKAHAEGRAHNIGESRWNNEPSWPEKWFMQVIENEFTDKNYVRERPFHRFSLDFAWEHKKKCIEIDGKQHEVFQEQIKRDLRKNELLKEEGWQLLRLKWKDVFHEPKKYIQIAKEFIDG